MCVQIINWKMPSSMWQYAGHVTKTVHGPKSGNLSQIKETKKTAYIHWTDGFEKYDCKSRRDKVH